MKVSTIIAVLIITALALVMGSQNSAHADFPSVTGEKIPSLAVHLTCHYIEHLPEKPKTNKELLLEYVTAYKNMERTITAASNENNYDLKLLPESQPRAK